jgi:hypothetical protein
MGCTNSVDSSIADDCIAARDCGGSQAGKYLFLLGADFRNAALRYNLRMWSPSPELNEPFDCPLCKSNEYYLVTFPRPNGTVYSTKLYQCGGCTAVFTEPERFSRLVRSTANEATHWREARETRDTPAYPDKWNSSAWMKKVKVTKQEK